MTNSSPDKAAIERADVDSFLFDLGLAAVISVPAKDPPDFILELGERRIGLEHTRYFRDTLELAADAEWKKFDRLLCTERMKGPSELDHVLVAVHLLGALPPKGARPQLAKEIVAAVRAELPLTHLEERSVGASDSFPMLASHVLELDIIQAGEARIVNWNAASASFLREASTDLLADAITKKTPARSAAESVSEFWLLITANASSISATAPGTSVEDLAVLKPALAVSGFTRVYFHDALAGRVFEWVCGGEWSDATGRETPRS